MNSDNCPSCNQADQLSTPRRPVTIGSSRTSKAVGIICMLDGMPI